LASLMICLLGALFVLDCTSMHRWTSSQLSVGF
jgi:hypothetical protein